MADEMQKPNTITTEQAARLLMISGERVRQLSKQGWITKVERDRYLLVDVVQGYNRAASGNRATPPTITAASSSARSASSRPRASRNGSWSCAGITSSIARP